MFQYQRTVSLETFARQCDLDGAIRNRDRHQSGMLIDIARNPQFYRDELHER